ncbi:Peptidase propeptide and YPEB domain protein [compost metagenome]
MSALGLYGALLALLLSGTAAARDIHQDEALRLRESGQILPLEQLLAPAMRRYPGARLLDVELEEKKGTLVYEIELLTTQGVVRELKLNARDGQILKDEVD